MVLLSTIAGLVDVISFLTLKIFAAHVTGNLVLIAPVLVGGRNPKPDQDLAVPVFVLATAAAWLIARLSRLQGVHLVRLLLVGQFVLLACVLLISIKHRPSVNQGGVVFTVDAMVAVSAIAFQFALLRIVIPNAPSTAVMTGNLSTSVLALLDLMARKPLVKDARERLRKQFSLLLGFFAGCTAGAAAVLWWGDWAWSLPVLLAALTLPLTAKL
jgi:uncharacterized membrane protein YoaK (UPF0700 family)